MPTSNWTKLNRIRLSSFFGAFIWKIGSACCPCFGRSVSAEESSWQAIARQFVKRMTTTTTPSAATEGQQLIKRTKSEEEILKKRPKRKVAAKKNNENEMIEKEASDVASVTSDVASVTSNVTTEAKENGKSCRKIKPPPLPARHIPPPAAGKTENKHESSNVDKTSTANVDKTSTSNVVDKVTKKTENHVGSNGTPRTSKSRFGPDSRFVTEEKRSQSMIRLTGPSNLNSD